MEPIPFTSIVPQNPLCHPLKGHLSPNIVTSVFDGSSSYSKNKNKPRMSCLEDVHDLFWRAILNVRIVRGQFLPRLRFQREAFNDTIRDPRRFEFIARETLFRGTI